MSKISIVFTGGGTLGHVMPNVYLIDELKRNGLNSINDNKIVNSKDITINYIGSNGIERDRVKATGVDFIEIPAVKLVRGKIFTNLKIPFVLVDAIFRAKKELKRLQPDVIFSKGGYVSLPVCIAGKMLKIPIIAHESDYSFGLANKIILKLADTMCVNFSHLERENKKIKYTGPIFSDEFTSKRKDKSRLTLHDNKPTILIVGGSLGSQSINELIFAILKDLLQEFNIIHITGKGNMRHKSFDNYNAYETTNEMANFYNICDFVIGRSGAGVTAESFYKHLPMLLIPLEKASRGDQLLNAKYYEKLGVAQILHETELTPTILLDAIHKFNKNLTIMKNKYKTIPQQNGKEEILKIINKYLKSM